MDLVDGSDDIVHKNYRECRTVLAKNFRRLVKPSDLRRFEPSLHHYVDFYDIGVNERIKYNLLSLIYKVITTHQL